MAPDAGSINNSAQQQSLLRSSPSPPLSDPDSQSSSPSASDSGNDIQSLLSGGWTAKDWKTLYHIVITHGLKLALVPFFVFLSWEALRTEPAAVQRAIDGVVEYVVDTEVDVDVENVVDTVGEVEYVVDTDVDVE